MRKKVYSDILPWQDTLPHKNLPFSTSSISFPPILYWSLLQDRNFAHQLWSRRSTCPTLERKRKILHEANKGRSLSLPHTNRPLQLLKRVDLHSGRGLPVLGLSRDRDELLDQHSGELHFIRSWIKREALVP